MPLRKDFASFCSPLDPPFIDFTRQRKMIVTDGFCAAVPPEPPVQGDTAAREEE